MDKRRNNAFQGYGGMVWMLMEQSYPRGIDSLSTSYPQIVDNLLFRGKAWILYIVDCFSSLLYVVFITLN